MATAIVASAAAEAVNVVDDTNEKKKKNKEVIEWQAGVLTLYSDGSFERCTDGHVPPSPSPSPSPSLTMTTSTSTSDEKGAASRDVQLDDSGGGVWARIFLPASVALSGSGGRRLPVVLHFHGGGFCVGSPAAPHTYAFCHTMTSASACLWLSVAYRLAPEHKLPAAYHDAMAAFRWLLTTHDPWIAAYADRSRIFVAGESAGGTIAHFLATDIAARDKEDWTSRLAGVIVVHPAFPQEKPPISDNVGNLSSARVRFYHQSALPAGAAFGHPLMNPLHPDSSGHVSRYPCSVPLLLAVAEHDPLCPGALLYFHALLHHNNKNKKEDDHAQQQQLLLNNNNNNNNIISDMVDTHHPAPPHDLSSSSSLFLFQSHGAEATHCFHLFPDKAPAAAAHVRHAILTFISRHRHQSSSSSSSSF